MVNVLFDLGNVLVHLDFERALRHWRSLVPAMPELNALYALPEVDALSRGKVTPTQFFDGLANRLKIGATVEAMQSAWCDVFSPWPQMESLADEVVAGGHPVYLASNTDTVHFELLRQQIPVLDKMRGHHLSYEIGLLKPQKEFFTTALSRFGLAAEECVFLDDRAENVAAAVACGIRGCVFDGDEVDARRFLSQAGALP